jgi:NDP-sugar pyrophosphorylase family protein
VVLAAGFGTRLRPLTLSLPKPLLPVAGAPVLAHTLLALRKAGCDEVAINLHYLGEKIASRFGSEFEGMPIRYSREKTIQGTLGALLPLRDFLGECDLAVVVNGDSLAPWPLAKLLRHHQQRSPEATVMVSSRARVEDYGGGIGLARDGQVTSFRPDSATARAPDPGTAVEVAPVRRRVFAGAQVLSPDLLRPVSKTPSDLVTDLYEPLLAEGARVEALESHEFWFDLGTSRRYLEGVLGWAARGRWGRRGWISPEADVSPDSSVRSSVLEAGVTVARGARIRRSLVLSGTSIGAGCRVTDSVLGAAVSLPSGTVVEKRVVTEARADTPPSAAASTVGRLVYEPLAER